MTYVINNSSIIALVEEEVSRVAAASYSDDGVSLYDSVVIHSRDADTISRLIGDAVAAIARRTADICTIISSPLTLSFSVPDMDASKEGTVSGELTRAISLSVCSAWLREKLPARSAEYTDRAVVALNNAVGLLKTRVTPTRV